MGAGVNFLWELPLRMTLQLLGGPENFGPSFGETKMGFVTIVVTLLAAERQRATNGLMPWR